MFHCFSLYNMDASGLYPVQILTYSCSCFPISRFTKTRSQHWWQHGAIWNWTGSWPGRRFWLHIFSVEVNQIWLFYHLNDHFYSFKCKDWNPISLVETCQTWKKAQIYSSGSSINPADWEVESTWRQIWTQSPCRTLVRVMFSLMFSHRWWTHLYMGTDALLS